MTTETSIIIERRDRSRSNWGYYCSCQRDGGDFTEESAMAEAERLAVRYEHYRFRAVRMVTTKEVLCRKVVDSPSPLP